MGLTEILSSFEHTFNEIYCCYPVKHGWEKSRYRHDYRKSHPGTNLPSCFVAFRQWLVIVSGQPGNISPVRCPAAAGIYLREGYMAPGGPWSLIEMQAEPARDCRRSEPALGSEPTLRAQSTVPGDSSQITKPVLVQGA